MAKSKRTKPIVASVTKSNATPEKKFNQIEIIRKNCNEFHYSYLVVFINYKTFTLQQIREAVKPGIMFNGKNRLLQVALGVNAETSYTPNLYKLGANAVNKTSLILTNKTLEELTSIFNEHHDDIIYAVPGQVSEYDITITETQFETANFASSLYSYFKNLEMPVKLFDAKLSLLGDLEICKKGEVLSNKQCKLLKALQIAIGTQQIVLKGYYSSDKKDCVIEDLVLSTKSSSSSFIPDVL